MSNTVAQMMRTDRLRRTGTSAAEDRSVAGLAESRRTREPEDLSSALSAAAWAARRAAATRSSGVA